MATKRITTVEIAHEVLADLGIEKFYDYTEDGSRVVISAACTRCGGGGYLPTIVDGGVCYGCNGANTRNAKRFVCVKKFASARRTKERARAKKEAARRADRLAGHRAVCAAHPEFVRVLNTNRENEFIDSVRSTVKNTGRASEKQIAAVLRSVENAKTRDADKAARKAAEGAVPVTNDRVSVSGKVISTKAQASDYGTQYKMLVEVDSDAGTYRLWGSVPTALLDQIRGEFLDVPEGGYLAALKGREVSFTARVEPSRDDVAFGFFSRPTKAKVLGGMTEEEKLDRAIAEEGREYWRIRKDPTLSDDAAARFLDASRRNLCEVFGADEVDAAVRRADEKSERAADARATRFEDSQR